MKSLRTQQQLKDTKFLCLRPNFNRPLQLRGQRNGLCQILYTYVPVFRPAPKPKLTFGQLLESIKNMDGLVFLPQWRNYMNRERALELSRVLRDYGGYNGLEWSLTSGFANPKLAALIRLRYPDSPPQIRQGWRHFVQGRFNSGHKHRS